MNIKTIICFSMIAGLASAEIVLYSNDGSSELNFGAGTVTNGTIGGITGDFIAIDNDYVGGGNYINVNLGDLDISAYDGQEWTLTYDVYSHVDIDDNVYSSVQTEFQGSGGAAANWYELDGQATWQTFSRSGTIAYVDGADANILFVSNTAGTTSTEAGTPPRYFLDNIEVTVVPEPASVGMVALVSGAGLLIRRRIIK